VRFCRAAERRQGKRTASMRVTESPRRREKVERADAVSKLQSGVQVQEVKALEGEGWERTVRPLRLAVVDFHLHSLGQ
jgi:hypothetical protein